MRPGLRAQGVLIIGLKQREPGSGGLSRQVPVEEFAVAAGVNPGEQVDDHVAGVGDVVLASGIVEVAGEVGEGGVEGQPALTKRWMTSCGSGGWSGSQSSATAWATRRSLMMVSSVANLRLRASMARRISERVMDYLEGELFSWMDRMRCWDGMVGKIAKFLSFPLISVHLSRERSGLVGVNGGRLGDFGGENGGFGGLVRGFGRARLGMMCWELGIGMARRVAAGQV